MPMKFELHAHVILGAYYPFENQVIVFFGNKRLAGATLLVKF